MTLQPAPILQDALGFAPWCLPRGTALPGTAMGPPEDWLRTDTAYAAQMALRDCLIADRTAPLVALGRLVAQDLCLLLPGPDGEHVLEAAVLCFPAGWTLSEKLGRPLSAIHRPVPPYDDGIARRVQRLFDGLRPGVVLERCNCLIYEDFALHAPLREADPRPPPGPDAPYLRLERQTLRRLPRTGAVVFAIHTAVLRRDRLGAEDRAALATYLRRGD